MLLKKEFTFTATGKTYKVRGDLTFKIDNVAYLISFKKCKQQYVGSAFENNFKSRFRIHKIDINTSKIRCGVARHFLNNCTRIKLRMWTSSLLKKLKKVIMTQKVAFGQEKKYSSAQLFTLTHGIVIERSIESNKNDILLFVFRMFDFVCIYSKVQHLCFGSHAYLNKCLIYIVKILFDSAIL